jgi:hypothetical protein
MFGFLLVHKIVCLAMDCGEYDRISYTMSWIFCLPIAALSLYFWWLAFLVV